MTLKRIVGFFAVVALASAALGADKWCVEESRNLYANRSHVARLRAALFSLSQLPEENALDPALMGRLAQESVFSLVNGHSLRSRYLGACDMDEDEFYREVQANDRFITLLEKFTTSEDFPAKRLIDQKFPYLGLWKDLEVAGPEGAARVLKNVQEPPRQMPVMKITYSDAIAKAISVSVEGGKMDASNPFFVARNELFGETTKWSDRDIQPVKVLINPKSLLYSLPLMKALSLHWDAGLKELSVYYLGPEQRR